MNIRKNRLFPAAGRMAGALRLIVSFALLAGYSAAQEVSSAEPEVVSLLGKSLIRTPAEGEALGKLEAALKEAASRLESDPENPDAIILYGRALAGLWRYHEAIEVYSGGIIIRPDHAMLYRHRGHRYISVREFGKAVADLSRAAELNDHDFDIWYHLGLAHYLLGEFDKALPAYEKCLAVATDDDSKIAVANWLTITLRRLGKSSQADTLLADIREGMRVVENQSYYELLFLYKGLKSAADIEARASASELDLATTGYGIGAWHLTRGETEKAFAIFRKIVETEYWPAFGYIAAEAELARVPHLLADSSFARTASNFQVSPRISISALRIIRPSRRSNDLTWFVPIQLGNLEAWMW